MELKPKLQRDLGGDLIRAVGERGNESEARRRIGEKAGICRMHGRRFLAEIAQKLSKPITQRVARPKRVLAMTRDADREHERYERRTFAPVPVGVQAYLRRADETLPRSA